MIHTSPASKLDIGYQNINFLQAKVEVLLLYHCVLVAIIQGTGAQALIRIRVSAHITLTTTDCKFAPLLWLPPPQHA